MTDLTAVTRNVLSIAIVSIVAGCRTNVSLGMPEEVNVASRGDAGVVCPSETSHVVAAIEPSLGELRAMAARDGSVVAAFARPDGSGAVTIAPSTGGAFVEIARVGADPTAIAFDGTFAYVACGTSGEVYRVRAGEASVVKLQAAVSSVIVGTGGRVHWTRPADDAVVGWTFSEGVPSVVATFPRAQSLAEHEGTIFIAGRHSVAAIGPNDAAPTKLADVCGGGAIAADREFVFCIDDGVLERVDVKTRAVRPLAGAIRGGKDVVVARGRAFFRTEGKDGASIGAVPIDGIGGPTVVDIVGPGSPALATDGCGLYYAMGAAINRRAL